MSIAFEVWFDSEPNDFAKLIKYIVGDGFLSVVDRDVAKISIKWELKYNQYFFFLKIQINIQFILIKYQYIYIQIYVYTYIYIYIYIYIYTIM